MKTITQISKQTKGKGYNLFVDNAFWCGITEDTLIHLNLKKGMLLEDTLLKQLAIEEEYNRCYNDALYLLGQRPYFEKALKDKLKQKDYKEETIKKVIVQLKANGYLNNETLAEAFIHDKKKFTKKGPRAIANALYAKGVDSNIIQNALDEQYDLEEEVENCKILLAKKVDYYQRRCSDSYTLKGKLYAFLAQRGYSSTAIKRAIDSIL